MARTLSAPRNLGLFGGIITALRLLSGERQPQNDEERTLLQALSAQDVNPDVARRMVGTLDAVPAAERLRLLGSIANAPFILPGTPIENTEKRARERLHQRLRDHRRSGGAAHAGGAAGIPGTVGELPTETDPWPDRDPSVRYTIRYVGLFCQNETDGPGSDEIYVLTSAIHINDGQNVVTNAIRNPVNYPDGAYYGDVDREEGREGPVTAAWSGNPDTVSLVVVVMEHDQGDPDAYRDEIDLAVKAAIAVATRLYPPAAVLALVEEQIVDVINWLFGTDDDIISTETVVLERAQLEDYARQSRAYYMGTKTEVVLGGGGGFGGGFGTITTTSPLTTHLFQHFVTKHYGDGAEYVIGFDVLRDPPLEGGGVIL